VNAVFLLNRKTGQSLNRLFLTEEQLVMSDDGCNYSQIFHRIIRRQSLNRERAKLQTKKTARQCGRLLEE